MLRDALHAMGGDEPGTIPQIVRLLENPASPIALPGSIDLYGHDCLHVLLGRGFSAEDEAFVVGFSMGTDEACRGWHVVVFKLVAFWLYPRVYRLNAAQLTVFDQGFAYGRSLERRNLHRLDWRSLVDESIAALREQLGLHCLIGESNNPPGLATP
jgi:hypothetical protein